MKKIYLFLSISILILQSCSSSDSSSSSSSQSMVGKWEYFQVKVFPAGTTITGNEELNNITFQCPIKKDYVQFWPEGTAKLVTYDQNCMEDSSIATWVKTDFLLNFNYNNNQTATWEIVYLDNSIMKIKYPNPSTGTPMEYIVGSFKKI